MAKRVHWHNDSFKKKANEISIDPIDGIEAPNVQGTLEELAAREGGGLPSLIPEVDLSNKKDFFIEGFGPYGDFMEGGSPRIISKPIAKIKNLPFDKDLYINGVCIITRYNGTGDVNIYGSEHDLPPAVVPTGKNYVNMVRLIDGSYEDGNTDQNLHIILSHQDPSEPDEKKNWPVMYLVSFSVVDR